LRFSVCLLAPKADILNASLMGYPCRVTRRRNARLRNAALNPKEIAMTDLESNIVTSIDSLRTLYAQPIERVAKKPLDHVNDVGRAFIAASPFLVLATGSRQGLDCSPKGDQPGFVQVAEGGRTLFIPDRRGNDRIDGLKNLIEDPRIALIFFVPGVNETYRVNGRAEISQDADLKRLCHCLLKLDILSK